MPDAQACVLERTDRDTTQLIDRMADRIEHLAHLPVPTFGNRDAQRGLSIVVTGSHLHQRALRTTSVDGDTS
jgi:hypothetical protein